MDPPGPLWQPHRLPGPRWTRRGPGGRPAPWLGEDRGHWLTLSKMKAGWKAPGCRNIDRLLTTLDTLRVDGNPGAHGQRGGAQAVQYSERHIHEDIFPRLEILFKKREVAKVVAEPRILE